MAAAIQKIGLFKIANVTAPIFLINKPKEAERVLVPVAAITEETASSNSFPCSPVAASAALISAFVLRSVAMVAVLSALAPNRAANAASFCSSLKIVVANCVAY